MLYYYKILRANQDVIIFLSLVKHFPLFQFLVFLNKKILLFEYHDTVNIFKFKQIHLIIVVTLL